MTPRRLRWVRIPPVPRWALVVLGCLAAGIGIGLLLAGRGGGWLVGAGTVVWLAGTAGRWPGPSRL